MYLGLCKGCTLYWGMFTEKVAGLQDSFLLAMKETVETSFQTIGSSMELHSVAKKLVTAEVTGDGTNKGAKDR